MKRAKGCSLSIVQNLAAGSESLSNLVREYKNCCKEQHEADIKLFIDSNSIERTLQLAATARDCFGRKHPHQRRIANALLERSARVLSTHLPALVQCSSFDEIHSLIKELTRGIKGLGELYVYDTALRISLSRDLQPTSVYLHRGTRDGAVKLGLNSRKATLDICELPKEMSELSPLDVEDFLCIYKNKF